MGVAIVLNGFYNLPLSQYQHPLFCLIVWFFSHLFPFADMYTLTVHIMIFTELFSLMFFLPENTLKKRIRKWDIQDFLIVMSLILFCIFLSAGLNLWRANYTIQASSFMFIGWVLLIDAKRKQKCDIRVLIGTVFISVGYMLRKEAGLLFFPFIGLLLASGIFCTRDRAYGLRNILRYYFPACMALLILLTSQAALDSLDPFAAAQRYNDARTAMVDFPIKPWDSSNDSFIGIEHADYVGAENWLLADTEIMNTETLEKMAGIGSMHKYSFSRDGLKSALFEMKRTAAETDVYMSILVILCILMSVWNSVFLQSIWQKIISASALSGAFIIIIYFTFLGRAPLRVWQPVLFGVLMLETALLMTEKSTASQHLYCFFILLIVVILYFSAGQVIAHTEFHNPQTAFLSRVDVDDSAYEKTFQNDALYIWPNWHATIPQYFGNMGKLPTERVLEHNIPLGDWTYGQPYYTEFLEKIGHPNPIKDLVESQNVYIMSDSSYILDFLRLHYGDNLSLVEADQINGTIAYRVKRDWSE